MKLHHIKIVQKDRANEKLWTSLDTEVYLDGVELKGVTRINCQIDAHNIPRIDLSLIGSFEIEGNVKESQLIIKATEEEKNVGKS